MNWKVDQFPPAGSMSFTPTAEFYFSSPKTLGSLQKKEPLEVLPPRVHTGVGARHALFPSDWLFGAWTNLSIHPAFCFGCQFPDAIHHPRFTAEEKFRPHSRAFATIPDRNLLSEASLPGSVRTCRYGRATHGVDPPTRITL
jgi:hypothetical protein